MRLLLYIVCFAVGVTTFSCSDYLDVNENPNQATSSTPELVLTNALNVSAGRLNHNEIGAYWSGQWAPSGSYSGFDGERTYNITSTFRTGNWTNTYDNLSDYKVVEATALKEGKMAIAGIARVMKAYNYQIIVDAYGNAPYTDALKGTTSIAPAYDDAEDIYDSLLNDIDKGKQYLSVAISSTNPSPGSSDIVFAGSTAKWKRFANTLKLRMLIRLSGVRDVSADVAALAADPDGFLKAGEDVTSNPGYVRSAGKMNQFYEVFGYSAGNARAGTHDAYAINEYIIEDHLKLNNDPRLATIAYKSTKTNEYKGVPLGGQSDEYLYPKISGIGPAVLPQDDNAATSDLYKRSQVLMTAAESFFLQAEAVQRGYMTSSITIDSIYNTGILESCRLNGLTGTTAGKQAVYNYFHQPSIKLSLQADKIKAIITQKWLAFANFTSFEAWCEFRRTGYPNVPLSIKALGTNHPVRLIYPQSEYSNNAANVNAQGTISAFTSKIFWDVN